MKKSLVLIMCLLLMVALVACKKGKGDDSSTNDATDTQVSESTGNEEDSTTTSGGDTTTDGTTDTTTEEPTTAPCEHPLSDEIVATPNGHYHVPECEHDDLILDLQDHTGLEDGVCDVCEYSVEDLIGDITDPKNIDLLKNSVAKYTSDETVIDIICNYGNGFLYMTNTLTYTSEEGSYSVATADSVHLLENGKILYLQKTGDEVTRLVNARADNMLGYNFSFDFYENIMLDNPTIGAENLLYAFYQYAKNVKGAELGWGKISFIFGDEYSAKSVDITYEVSEKGTLKSMTLTAKTYYGSEEKYTISDDDTIIIAEGAEPTSGSTLVIEQLIGDRDDIRSEFDLDKMLLKAYELELDGTKLSDTISFTEGDYKKLNVVDASPEGADYAIDNIRFTVTDENGKVSSNIDIWGGNDGTVSVLIKEEGNYIITFDTLLTTKTYKVSVAKLLPTKLEAITLSGNTVTSRTLAPGTAFEFIATAQSSYADAKFIATLPEGTEGATLTVLDTADGYSFVAEKEGTYVVTLTAVADANVTTTITFEVKDPNSTGFKAWTLVSGKYIGKDIWDEDVVVTIEATDETSGKYTVRSVWGTDSYTYVIEDKKIVGTVVSGHGSFQLKFDDKGIMYATDGADSISLEAEGGSASAGTLATGTYVGKDSFEDTVTVTIEVTDETSGTYTITSLFGSETYTYVIEDGDIKSTHTGGFVHFYTLHIDADGKLYITDGVSGNIPLTAGEGGDDSSSDMPIGSFTGEIVDATGEWVSAELEVTEDGYILLYIGDTELAFMINGYENGVFDVYNTNDAVYDGYKFSYDSNWEMIIVEEYNDQLGMGTEIGAFQLPEGGDEGGDEGGNTDAAFTGIYTGIIIDFNDGKEYEITLDATWSVMDTFDLTINGVTVTYYFEIDPYFGTMTVTNMSPAVEWTWDLQFTYDNTTDTVLISEKHPYTGFYANAAELTKGDSGVSGVDELVGYWSDKDGEYTFAFYDDGSGSAYCTSEDAQVTFTWKKDADGFVSFVFDEGCTSAGIFDSECNIMVEEDSEGNPRFSLYGDGYVWIYKEVE